MSTSQEVSPGQVIEITVLRAATCYFFLWTGCLPEGSRDGSEEQVEPLGYWAPDRSRSNHLCGRGGSGDPSLARCLPDTNITRSGFFVAVGLLLLAIGVPILVVSVRSVMRAYEQDQLATRGLLALVRHPIYSAWIVFILPGLAFLSRSWPMLVTPLVAYAVFKVLIHREDDYLQQRFGDAYLDYRARVNELIPVPKFWRRSAKAVPNAN
jgi:protein-S-isoprenylcysteine O-methyltransferase Ste14